MKALLSFVPCLLIAAAAPAQGPAQIFTRPSLVPQEVLNRLNLRLAWRTYVPTEGRRDGLFHIQFAGPQMLVQTRSGLLAAYDRDTGEPQWRTRLGKPYSVQHPAAYNAASFFVPYGTSLYALDRRTGQLQWQLSLPSLPEATPAADTNRLYLTVSPGRLLAYAIPDHGAGAAQQSTAPEARADTGLSRAGEVEVARDRPVLLWDFQTLAGIEQPPILYPGAVVVVNEAGSFFAFSTQYERRQLAFPFAAPLGQPLVQHGDTFYVASRDNLLYAVQLPDARLQWRYVARGPITARPAVTDQDVYLSVEGSGLVRLDRATGEEMWQQPAGVAQRFLAANDKFVYATDRSGRLLVLDRRRGTQLSAYDGVRDYVFPVANEVTDRIYLAAHDGLIICLYDRDYTAPLLNRRPPQPPQPQKAAPGVLPVPGGTP